MEYRRREHSILVWECDGISTGREATAPDWVQELWRCNRMRNICGLTFLSETPNGMLHPGPLRPGDYLVMEDGKVHIYNRRQFDMLYEPVPPTKLENIKVTSVSLSLSDLEKLLPGVHIKVDNDDEVPS